VLIVAVLCSQHLRIGFFLYHYVACNLITGETHTGRSYQGMNMLYTHTYAHTCTVYMHTMTNNSDLAFDVTTCMYKQLTSVQCTILQAWFRFESDSPIIVLTAHLTCTCTLLALLHSTACRRQRCRAASTSTAGSHVSYTTAVCHFLPLLHACALLSYREPVVAHTASVTKDANRNCVALNYDTIAALLVALCMISHVCR
jgi:hypothetical protein